MAVAPLFLADMTKLKSRLRLSSATQPDVLAALDGAAQEVRLGFYERLGESRVTQLLTYSSTDNPTSSTELERVRAESAEAIWVELLLVRQLPLVYLDASGFTSQRWNEEPLTRTANSREVRDIEASLRSRLEAALESLVGSSTDPRGGRVFVQSPEETPPRPFETVYPPVPYFGVGYGQRYL